MNVSLLIEFDEVNRNKIIKQSTIINSNNNNDNKKNGYCTDMTDQILWYIIRKQVSKLIWQPIWLL